VDSQGNVKGASLFPREIRPGGGQQHFSGGEPCISLKDSFPSKGTRDKNKEMETDRKLRG